MSVTFDDVVFVFGSNRKGIHGAGAARHARERYGAEPGVGEGRTGRAYAIPTKATPSETLAFEEIEAGILRFRDHARAHPKTLFLLTPIACGLAGVPAPRIARIVQDAEMPRNVVLTTSWAEHLAKAG